MSSNVRQDIENMLNGADVARSQKRTFSKAFEHFCKAFENGEQMDQQLDVLIKSTEQAPQVFCEFAATYSTVTTTANLMMVNNQLNVHGGYLAQMEGKTSNDSERVKNPSCPTRSISNREELLSITKDFNQLKNKDNKKHLEIDADFCKKHAKKFGYKACTNVEPEIRIFPEPAKRLQQQRLKDELKSCSPTEKIIIKNFDVDTLTTAAMSRITQQFYKLSRVTEDKEKIDWNYNRTLFVAAYKMKEKRTIFNQNKPHDEGRDIASCAGIVAELAFIHKSVETNISIAACLTSYVENDGHEYNDTVRQCINKYIEKNENRKNKFEYYNVLEAVEHVLNNKRGDRSQELNEQTYTARALKRIETYMDNATDESMPPKTLYDQFGNKMPSKILYDQFGNKKSQKQRKGCMKKRG